MSLCLTCRCRLRHSHRSRSFRLLRSIPFSPLFFVRHIRFLSPNLSAVASYRRSYLEQFHFFTRAQSPAAPEAPNPKLQAPRKLQTFNHRIWSLSSILSSFVIRDHFPRSQVALGNAPLSSKLRFARPSSISFFYFLIDSQSPVCSPATLAGLTIYPPASRLGVFLLPIGASSLFRHSTFVIRHLAI
jgi:hypothetical protein